MIESHLFINRLVIVLNDGRIAYNETFHKGVNIIRGNNSTGKSTISHFLFYILGGEFVDFVPEAKECSVVYAETEMNGAQITLKRYLEVEENRVKTRMPIFFYWGSYAESINPPHDRHWQRFGYNATETIKSFSNVIFDNLNIPKVKADSNITIHQLLRLMYIDQESPTGSLFLYEQFDSSVTRQTIADLLLGIYDDELYQRRMRSIAVQKEIEDVKARIRATKGFYNNSLDLNPIHIETRIENVRAEISNIEGSISELKTQTRESEIQPTDFRYHELSQKILKQREVVTSLEKEISLHELEIADNVYFIESLQTKKTALNNSVQVRDFLHEFDLTFCPECLGEIKDEEIEHEVPYCKLCKQPMDSTYAITQSRRLAQEIDFQITESKQVQAAYKKELEHLIPTLNKEKGVLIDLQTQFDNEVGDVNSSRQEEILKLSTQKGYQEGELMQLRTMLEHAEIYNSLEKKLEELNREAKSIGLYIRQAENKQIKLREKIEQKIREEALYFLNNDIHRQDEFRDAKDFNVDFSNNIAFLSNKYAKFSASSNFYLKVTARFAVFLASLSIPEMRYPRFILADNMEDKGIEPLRAQNLQKKLVERLSSFDVNRYQVIYTTSYIPEELNVSAYVVGDFHTEKNRTLNPSRYNTD